MERQIQFIRERISDLRCQKQVSERKMSLDLGHSTSYIRSITSGKSLPSITEFLYICDYLGITPREFFNNNAPTSLIQQEAISFICSLSDDDIFAIGSGNVIRADSHLQRFISEVALVCYLFRIITLDFQLELAAYRLS